MVTTVKMCDMSKGIATAIFKMLNYGNVQLKENSFFGKIIITDIEPKDLLYPEGWYYGKGSLRNKHTSTTGFYDEIPMVKSNGESWEETAHYCTLN